MKSHPTTERIAPKSSAHRRSAMAKPGTNTLVRITRKVLIATVKRPTSPLRRGWNDLGSKAVRNPSVASLTGQVRRWILGRIIAFASPNMNATTIAPLTLSTVIPGKTCDAPSKTAEIRNQ